MAEEIVKLRISAEADTGALDRTKAKINELRIEAEDLRKAAGKYAEKYGFEDSRAKSARSEATTREREANRLERPFLAEEKTEQKSARDEKARHLRSQRAEDRAAAADERAVKREMHQEGTRRQRFGRAGMQLGMEMAQGGSLQGGISSLGNMGGLKGMGLASVALAVGELVKNLVDDAHERQGIALRSQATQKMNERGLAIGASWRGTSGQVQSEQFATEQRMAERAANRDELSRKGERALYNPLRLFGKHTWEGKRALDENDEAQKNDANLVEKQKALKRKKFTEEEGGIGLDMLRHRGERTQSGQRAAFMDEYAIKALQTKRRIQTEGGSEAEGTEGAKLEAANSLRERQVAAGASLVNARSGAGDIAAAARWGSMSTPGEAEMVKRLDGVLSRMDVNSHAMEKLTSKDQSIK